mmetsp:Transcript_12045/g.16347  ORF Transcript_12045/g.16347 Transcript_12045/m.16347 type:complete len:87 (-) Transcript_12045:496-756(-)
MKNFTRMSEHGRSFQVGPSDTKNQTGAPASIKQNSVQFSQRFLEQDREVSIIVADNASNVAGSIGEHESPFVPYARPRSNVFNHID